MPLVYLAIAWQAGILAADLLWKRGLFGCSLPPWILALPALVALVAGLVSHRRSRLALVFLCMAAFCLGASRYQQHPLTPCFSPRDIAYYHREVTPSVTLEGMVVAYPTTNDSTVSYRLAADTVLVGNSAHAVRGLVQVQAGLPTSFSYGDRLRVVGRLKTPPTYEDYDYRGYLAQMSVHSLLHAAEIEQLEANQGNALMMALSRLRAHSSHIIRQSLPEPAAAMAEGILLGMDTGLSAELRQAFSITGATHILVISGSNIAVLCGILLGMLRPLVGQRRAAILAMLGVGLYVLLVGADPPAFRAGVMGAIYLFGILVGRQRVAITALALAAVVLTAVNPLVLWNISYQLSFAASLGLILFGPLLQAPLTNKLEQVVTPGITRSILMSLIGVISTTVAAQMAVLPLAIASFGMVPLLSLPVNLLILPVQPAVLGAGLVMVALGFVWLPLASIPAAIVWLLLSYSSSVVKLAANAPFASVDIHQSGWTLPAVAYAMLLMIYFSRWRFRSGTRALNVPTLARLAGLATVALLAVLLIPRVPDGRLHLFYLPDSAGASTLVITPSGRSLLVWDGKGEAAILERYLEQLPRGSTRLTMAIAPNAAAAPPAGRKLDASTLPYGSQLLIDDRVMLRPASGSDSLFELQHGSFGALLPECDPVQCQAAIEGTHQGTAVTVLRTHPTPLSHMDWNALKAPSGSLLALWPDEHSDESTSLPAGVALGLVPEDAIAEIVTDGQRFWLRQWYGGQELDGT